MSESRTKVTVRFFNDADVARIPAFFEGVSEASRHFFHPHSFDREAVAEIAEGIRDPDSVHVGAFSGEKLIGHVWYARKGGKPYPGLGIGIVDAFHNQGIGKRLMQRIEGIARERGERGLSLSCYPENHRALRVYAKQGYRLAGRTGDGAQFRMVRNFADDETPFAIRGVYASSIPWNIAPLTTDTWSLDDWKWYIELLNAAGCNLLKLYIWPTQYHHPDEPKLASNAWRYPVWRQALAYARVMGMETQVGFSTGCVPPFAFFLDPKGGFESANILPEPKLGKIDAWLDKGLEERHTASLAYRLTPYTQYPGDYYFFRRQLNPAQSRESVLAGLGEYVCNPRQGSGCVDGTRFASAVESLEQWWEMRREQDLEEAASGLTSLAATHDSVRDLADAAALLRLLPGGLGNQSLEEFSEDLRLRMSTMPVFRGLTLDHLWSGRARAFLQLRVKNWLHRLQQPAS